MVIIRVNTMLSAYVEDEKLGEVCVMVKAPDIDVSFFWPIPQNTNGDISYVMSFLRSRGEAVFEVVSTTPFKTEQSLLDEGRKQYNGFLTACGVSK